MKLVCKVLIAIVFMHGFRALYANNKELTSGAVDVKSAPDGYITKITIDHTQWETLGDDLTEYFDQLKQMSLVSIKELRKKKQFFLKYDPGVSETDEDGMPLPGSLPRDIRIDLAVKKISKKRLILETFVSGKDYFLLAFHGKNIYLFLSEKREKRREKLLLAYNNNFSIPLELFRIAVGYIYQSDKYL